MGVIESDVAEVCWFVRGRTLYRRVLLVAPSAPIGNYTANGFYANNDISVRYNAANGMVVPNTLADLTKRVRSCPLGAGALAGNPFGVDRQALAACLGFTGAAIYIRC